MKLEEALKMKEFPDLHLKAFLEILYTASEIRNHQKKFFKPFGLSPEQYNILRILRGSHPKSLTINEIKIRMVDKTPHTTRMIDKLELSRLVSRERVTSDRRKIFIRIRSKGLDLMRHIDVALPDFLLFMHNLSIEEAQILSSLLEKIRAIPIKKTSPDQEKAVF